MTREYLINCLSKRQKFSLRNAYVILVAHQFRTYMSNFLGMHRSNGPFTLSVCASDELHWCLRAFATVQCD